MKFREFVAARLSAEGVESGGIEEAVSAFERLTIVDRPTSTKAGDTERYVKSLALFLKAERAHSGEAITGVLPHVLDSVPQKGYRVETDGRVTRRVLANGDNALFWNGTDVVPVRFGEEHNNRVRDYTLLGRDLLGMIEGAMPRRVIVDLGAGTGSFSVYFQHLLRAGGHAAIPVINVERDPFAAVFAELLVERAGLSGIVRNLVTDLRLATRDTFWSYLKASVGAAAGTGAAPVVITRMGLHPYYADAQYEMLFEALVRDVGVTAGMHLEGVGFRTPTFRRIAAQFTAALEVGTHFTENPADPYAVLKASAGALGIEIVREIEVWPQIILDYFLSYLSWRTAGAHG